MKIDGKGVIVSGFIGGVVGIVIPLLLGIEVMTGNLGASFLMGAFIGISGYTGASALK